MRIFLALLLSSLAWAQSPSPRPILINDFGAVPDCQVSASGAIQYGTDAGPAFNQAIDAWAAQKGVGAVSALPGDYCVFSPVTQFGGGFLLDVAGDLGVRLYIQTPSATTFTFTARNTVFRDWLVLGSAVNSSYVDSRRVVHAYGNAALTVERVQFYGTYVYDVGRNGAIVGADNNMLTVRDSGFYGTCANPYGGAVVGPAVHITDTIFQDYGTIGEASYEKTWNEQITWILCTMVTQQIQSFGAPRRADCTVERSRFDEGAKWQIWAAGGAESALPGARRQRVVVRDNAFMTPAVTQGRSVNIRDTDDVQVHGNHFAIRWDEPAISCYGCGDVKVSGVSWRPLGAADGWPNTPPGLILKILADPYTRSLDVRNVGGAIVQAGAPTLVYRDGGMPVLSAAPTVPQLGQFFYNSATATIDVWDGAVWRKAALQ